METIFRPKDSRLFPTKESRLKAKKRVLDYPKDMFHTYEDWFFFIHIDPVQRFWHLIGMIVGSYFFFMLFYAWNKWSLLYYPLGVFFFYGFGILSHLTYDKGTAKSEPRYFIKTLWPVIEINLRTFSGTYDTRLRGFIEKYPFVIEAFELEEVPKENIIKRALKLVQPIKSKTDL